ncbi:MAG: hypothetical protein IJQ48_05415 [Prevotella sp.]|nr:hypothetical protein [Prevotella sp.]
MKKAYIEPKTLLQCIRLQSALLTTSMGIGGEANSSTVADVKGNNWVDEWEDY